MDLAVKFNFVQRDFLGTTKGDGLLFKSVVNVYYGVEETKLITSTFFKGASVFCKPCGVRIGWQYIKSDEQSAKYKEGMVCLETEKIVLNRDKIFNEVDDDSMGIEHNQAPSLHQLYTRYTEQLMRLSETNRI